MISVAREPCLGTQEGCYNCSIIDYPYKARAADESAMRTSPGSFFMASSCRRFIQYPGSLMSELGSSNHQGRPHSGKSQPTPNTIDQPTPLALQVASIIAIINSKLGDHQPAQTIVPFIGSHRLLLHSLPPQWHSPHFPLIQGPTTRQPRRQSIATRNRETAQ